MTLRFTAATVVVDIEGTTSATELGARSASTTTPGRGSSRGSTTTPTTRRRRRRSPRRSPTPACPPTRRPTTWSRALHALDGRRRQGDAAEDAAGPDLGRRASPTGELTSHFFDDVVPRCARWHARGVRPGRVLVGLGGRQRPWFRHAPAGDLTPLFDGLLRHGQRRAQARGGLVRRDRRRARRARAGAAAVPLRRARRAARRRAAGWQDGRRAPRRRAERRRRLRRPAPVVASFDELEVDAGVSRMSAADRTVELERAPAAAGRRVGPVRRAWAGCAAPPATCRWSSTATRCGWR